MFNLPQPESIPSGPRAPSPDIGDAMQVESDLPGAPTESTETGGADDMQVDEPGATSDSSAKRTVRRTTRNIKPVDRDSKVTPPTRKSKGKGKQQKKTPITVKPEAPRSHALVVGSKYMQFSVIDLTQVEVSTILL